MSDAIKAYIAFLRECISMQLSISVAPRSALCSVQALKQYQEEAIAMLYFAFYLFTTTGEYSRDYGNRYVAYRAYVRVRYRMNFEDVHAREWNVVCYLRESRNSTETLCTECSCQDYPPRSLVKFLKLK